MLGTAPVSFPVVMGLAIVAGLLLSLKVAWQLTPKSEQKAIQSMVGFAKPSDEPVVSSQSIFVQTCPLAKSKFESMKDAFTRFTQPAEDMRLSERCEINITEGLAI